MARPPAILCMDDNISALKIRTLLLQRAGYDVIACTNGAEALKIFKSEDVDLVVSDHFLPGVSGAQLVAEMKLLRPQVPVILFSGMLEEPEGGIHADLFLTKGAYSPQHLLDSIAELLTKAAGRAAS